MIFVLHTMCSIMYKIHWLVITILTIYISKTFVEFVLNYLATASIVFKPMEVTNEW